MLQQEVKKELWQSWAELPPAAADPSAEPRRVLQPQPVTAAQGIAAERCLRPRAAAAAVDLLLGTAARGTLAGVLPADAAKMEPGKIVSFLTVTNACLKKMCLYLQVLCSISLMLCKSYLVPNSLPCNLNHSFSEKG